jgi:hypothetical protein
MSEDKDFFCRTAEEGKRIIAHKDFLGDMAV